MFTLFVAVTVLENLKAFYAAVYVLDKYSVARKCAVKLLFQLGQRTVLGRLERRQTVCVQVTNALITFIRNQKNVLRQMHLTLPKQLHIVNRAFCFMDAYYFTGLTVDDDLVFYSVTFLFAGITLFLFF